MKIVIFGLTVSSSWGNGHATPYRAILRALDRLGHSVHFFEKDVPYYAARRDFHECHYCKLTLYRDWASVRAQALAAAGEADAVICASFCPEGARIIDDVLELDGPVHAFYDLDTPVTLARLREAAEEEGLDYLRRDQISRFDTYLSFTGGPILNELVERWGARQAHALYGCVDPDVYAREPARAEFRCLLSYMGTYAPDRQQKLDALFLEPARRLWTKPFVLAGSLYPWQWQWPANVRRFEHVAPGDHAAFYSSSRATLNITRAEMAQAGYCPSGRFFEAAACGTPLLSDWFAGLDSFFRTDGDDREIVTVKDAGDVVAALKLPEAELQAMAARARRRTLDEHSGARRAQQLLGYLELARQGQSREHAVLKGVA
jgi:spore maturation protein CgeB